jgi:hypothetical protein
VTLTKSELHLVDKLEDARREARELINARDQARDLVKRAAQLLPLSRYNGWDENEQAAFENLRQKWLKDAGVKK